VLPILWIRSLGGGAAFRPLLGPGAARLGQRNLFFRGIFRLDGSPVTRNRSAEGPSAIRSGGPRAASKACPRISLCHFLLLSRFPSLSAIGRQLCRRPCCNLSDPHCAASPRPCDASLHPTGRMPRERGGVACTCIESALAHGAGAWPRPASKAFSPWPVGIRPLADALAAGSWPSSRSVMQNVIAPGFAARAL